MANVHRHEETADHVMGGLDQVQRRLLDAGLLLLAGGWHVLVYGAIIGNRATNAEHALVGFALLLLGVFLLMLSPVAHRFPGATRLGTAVADAVLFYLELALARAGN